MQRRDFIRMATAAGVGIPSWALLPVAQAQSAVYTGKILINVHADGGLDQSSWVDPPARGAPSADALLLSFRPHAARIARADGERDPDMHQTKKGNQWHFGMKAHIGVDAESGLVHTVIGTPANVNDVTQAGALLHGEETAAFGDAGYRGVDKREEAHGPVWFVAMQPGKRRALDLTKKWARLLEKAEQLKASVRAKVEHPFHVIKNLFRHKKVRYKGLAKNEAQLFSLFGLANLVIAKGSLLDIQARGAS